MRIETNRMLETNPRVELAVSPARFANRQQSQLLIALSLLLFVLAVVLVKDRGFWFGPNEALEADDASEMVATADAVSVPAETSRTPVAQAAHPKNHLASKISTAPAVTEPLHQSAAGPNSSLVVTSRAVLPPLVIEVVAGDTHSTLHPGSNVAKVAIPGNSNRIPAVAMASLPTNAAEREPISSESVAEPRQPVDSTYPLLGQHSSVWGSVVLQAVVSADGTIENLRVISGPAILTTAAEQAVRQWRFKPYLQNGRPVETKARMTVNFSIRVHESS